MADASRGATKARGTTRSKSAASKGAAKSKSAAGPTEAEKSARESGIRWSIIDSPVGKLLAAVRGTAAAGAGPGGRCVVVQLDFLEDADEPVVPEDWVRDDAACQELRRQVDEYFEGERREFDLELDVHGTDFQMEVWAALRDIPYGQTASYANIAEAVGRPQAVRAVGGANHNNPVSIIVPCHRVIGADGTLTGYGGGLDTKEALLSLEAGVLREAG